MTAPSLRQSQPTTPQRSMLEDVVHYKPFQDDDDEDNNNVNNDASSSLPNSWIRGVNLGGWLVLERYITPYQFAVTTCHQDGQFCYYPGQINAPPTDAPLCNDSTIMQQECHPIQFPNVFGQLDYPLDEATLWTRAFGPERVPEATAWLNTHLQHFITEQDIRTVAEAGVTHLRIPLPHWILQDQDRLTQAHVEASRNNSTLATNVPPPPLWIVGARWQAFRRLITWARRYGLQVWPDIHTAPGSQNGFDNSGHQLPYATAANWCYHPDRVQESLSVLQNITATFVAENMTDVVTGVGLLNEPFTDTDHAVYRDYLDQALAIVRETMGRTTSVYASDLFDAKSFNDGHWWLDPTEYKDTYLDSHYYHVFAENTRTVSPRQHIALVCQNEYHTHRNIPQPTYWWDYVWQKWDPSQTELADQHHVGVTECCWQDGPHRNSVPSRGVRRMVGEWSAAVDVLTADKLYAVMQHIAANGTALDLHRQLSPQRQAFLRQFVLAQMVVYEVADADFGGAWFFWTLKMEGGAFAEWDFLRGQQEGWIPNPLPEPHVSSSSVYGSCYDIMLATPDNMALIHEYPLPMDSANNWQGFPLTDDVVLTHGDSLLRPNFYREKRLESLLWSILITVVLVGLAMLLVRLHQMLRERACQKKKGYLPVPEAHPES